MNKDMLLSLFIQIWYSFKASMLPGFHVKNLRLRVIVFTKKRNRKHASRASLINGHSNEANMELE